MFTTWNKNSLSVLDIKDKSFAMEFKIQQSSSSQKNSSLDTTQVIGVKEGNLYNLQGEPGWALVHNSDNMC